MTKLLPKSCDADELKDVNGWRPITTGSLVLRLFSRILTMRLTRACPMNPRQRGFLASSNGCADNLMVLNGIIRHSREEGTSLAVVFVDFAKAFDSISHEHILSVLEQRLLDRHVIELIKNSYVDCVTMVGSGGDKTSPINMKVGVKQGDPMSPLSFCQLTGLKIQPRKCHGFFLNKGVVNDCQPWTIGGTPLHLVGPGEAVRYLGVEVGPRRGIVVPDLAPQLQEWIVRIKKAPLEPTQRVRVLNSFALPRLIYQEDHCDVPGTTLATLDGVVRKAVKSWLYLAQSTCNGLLYSRNRDGGLGIVRLEGLIPSLQVRRIYRLSRSQDHMTRLITVRTVALSEWQRRWQMVGGDPDNTPGLEVEEGVNADERSLVVKDWIQGENEAWLALQVQGVGASEFTGNKISK